jgi:hypothetical protein
LILSTPERQKELDRSSLLRHRASAWPPSSPQEAIEGDDLTTAVHMTCCMRSTTPLSSKTNDWYVSNVSIIFDTPCLFLHHLLSVSLHSVVFLCIFWN